MQSGKPGGFFKGMFRGDDHQKEQIAGANPLKPLTDGNRAFDPSLQGVSEHRASPRCESAHMGEGEEAEPAKFEAEYSPEEQQFSVTYHT